MKNIALAHGQYIETWYARKTRSYVTQLKDEQGNQVGEAYYGGSRASAIGHRMFLSKDRKLSRRKPERPDYEGERRAEQRAEDYYGGFEA
jgi:hypothetical protein